MKPLLLASICMLLATTLAYAGQATNSSGAPAQSPATAIRDAVQKPVPPPVATPEVELILKTMGRSSTAGHPDLFGEFAGMRRLFAGDYKDALKYFKMGARYADKLSQITIGNMYLSGRGVSKDPATACAWITLAAERGYPIYVQARDQVCKSLSSAQHDQAMAVLDTLRPEYGDAVAKPRMESALRAARLALTGSRVGYDFGVQSAALNYPELVRRDQDCARSRLTLGGVEVPVGLCGRYNPELFDAKKYFAARDAQWFGTATVGELQNVDPPLSRAEKKRSDDGQ